ncbi:MAG: hypothetical protein N2Z75_10710, partial [Meiothermus sp.]|nr:hypothetical protein [Meiothermus sp.]
GQRAAAAHHPLHARPLDYGEVELMRYGLPTQEEVNRWDDLERAKGREMVRVVDIETLTAKVEQALEANNLELWVSSEFVFGWSAAAICKESRVCKMVAYGHSKHTAIENLFFKIKWRGVLE